MAEQLGADPPATGRGAEQVAGGGAIAQAFAAAREQGRAALMPYMMGGYPDPATSAAIADAYAEGGADLVEFGVPYSDPLADGPVIHAAGTAALEAGATLDGVLQTCERLSARVPVVIMAYTNMALARGPQAFASALAQAGASGAIFPDLPPEEGGEIANALRGAGLALIPLIAPTTPPERRARICGEAEGFVYVVSDTRTTGERDELPADLRELVASCREEAEVPVAVGFGIGTAEQAAAVGSYADGVIIGSRLVRAAGEGGPEAVLEFMRSARGALDSG